MPNWVYNKVTIEGPLAEVERFQQQANTDQVLSFETFVPSPGEDNPNWYEWNIKNWGTKWDACRPMVGELERHADGVARLEYEFETAWAEPEPVFRAMAEQFPALVFDITYNEEQGWGGEYHGSGGELSRTEEWDIPSSHEEKERRNGQCYCDYMEDLETEFMFDDCPKKMALVSA
jgi:hypothetical protein